MTEMPWACVMDSVSASLSIRLVLFCLSACICNPSPSPNSFLSPSSFRPPFILRRDGGIQAEEAVTLSQLAKERTTNDEKKKGWHFFSNGSTFRLLRHPCPLPAPSLPPSTHPSINHSAMPVVSGIMASNMTVARLDLNRLRDDMQRSRAERERHLSTRGKR